MSTQAKRPAPLRPTYEQLESKIRDLEMAEYARRPLAQFGENLVLRLTYGVHWKDWTAYEKAAFERAFAGAESVANWWLEKQKEMQRVGVTY